MLFEKYFHGTKNHVLKISLLNFEGISHSIRFYWDLNLPGKLKPPQKLMQKKFIDKFGFSTSNCPILVFFFRICLVRESWQCMKPLQCKWKSVEVTGLRSKVPQYSTDERTKMVLTDKKRLSLNIILIKNVETHAKSVGSIRVLNVPAWQFMT